MMFNFIKNLFRKKRLNYVTGAWQIEFKDEVIVPYIEGTYQDAYTVFEDYTSREVLRTGQMIMGNYRISPVALMKH